MIHVLELRENQSGIAYKISINGFDQKMITQIECGMGNEATSFRINTAIGSSPIQMLLRGKLRAATL